MGDGDVLVFWASESTDILRGLFLERGMVGTKFPVVEGKRRGDWSWWVANRLLQGMEKIVEIPLLQTTEKIVETQMIQGR